MLEIFLASFVIIVLFFVVISIIIGAPYVPIVSWVIDNVIVISSAKKGERAIDLGSGDGRVVIALAKKGLLADGYEINPFLVALSKYKIKRANVKNARIYLGNFWNLDISNYDIVTIFVVPYIMEKLEKKLRAQLKKGARVITMSHPFPHWTPVKKGQSVYLYIQK